MANAEMNAAIISAAVSVAVALLTALISYLLKSRQQRERQRCDALKILDKYRKPLAVAAFHLQSRFHNILDRGLLG